MMENRKTNNKPHRRRGFTAVEMMTVVALLGILMMIVMPRVVPYVHAGENSKRKADMAIILSAVQKWRADNEDTGYNPTDFNTQNTQGRRVHNYIQDEEILRKIGTKGSDGKITQNSDSIYIYKDGVLTVHRYDSTEVLEKFDGGTRLKK